MAQLQYRQVAWLGSAFFRHCDLGMVLEQDKRCARLSGCSDLTGQATLQSSIVSAASLASCMNKAFAEDLRRQLADVFRMHQPYRTKTIKFLQRQSAILRCSSMKQYWYEALMSPSGASAEVEDELKSCWNLSRPHCRPPMEVLGVSN